MQKTKSISSLRPVTGLSRLLFGIRMRWSVFFHLTKACITGRRSLKETLSLLFRLQEFSRRHSSSKFMRFDGGVRMGLYVPTFPGKPFLRAAESMCGDPARTRLVSAVVSVTNDCPFRCEYCYQRGDAGALIPLDKLRDAVRDIQNAGAALMILEGGEPFSAFDRLLAVCETIDERSEIWINTTGAGMTRERLLALRERGLTAFKISVHHHTEEGHNRFLGSNEGWSSMNNAVTLCQELAIPFTFNCRMFPHEYFDGTFDAMLAFARERGALYLQCLTPRSAGGYLGRPSLSLTSEELERLGVLIRRYNRGSENRRSPGIFCDEYDERVVYGCTAGAGRLYLSARGAVQPCQHINVAFGNCTEEPMDVLIERMRMFFKRPGKCTACTKVAASVAACASKGFSLPVPFSSVKNEWDTMAWGDFSYGRNRQNPEAPGKEPYSR
jgi:MoaA/NifB/PqqE/SkfB family radical SAM enzyme